MFRIGTTAKSDADVENYVADISIRWPGWIEWTTDELLSATEREEI